ncbi:MAG TPA: DUF3828 domain-containing protein [Sphingomicrobium sp.]|jgi:hypothetical protein
MILFALLAAAAQPAETPKAYMQRLYANYRHSDYSPLTHPERVFASRLLAAINEDSKLARGEVGYLDGDPLCQCQDTGGMRPSITNVTQHGRDKATVRVSIGWKGEKARRATFNLVRTRNGWRIADVSSADEPSLLGALEASNSKARVKH